MRAAAHLGNNVHATPTTAIMGDDVGPSSINDKEHNQSLDLETPLTATTIQDALVDDEVKRDNDVSNDDDEDPSLGFSHHHHMEPSWPPQHFSYHPRVRIPQLIATASWYELSGSLGDLGTFLPLVTALGQARAIHVGPALVYAGLANIVTGYVWDCPMPVQPMKSIAATALYAAWSAQTVTAAGIFMGVALTVLAVFPAALTWLVALVPMSVVAGMQVGVGLSLAIHGLEWLRQLPLWGVDSIVLGLLCGALTLVTLRPSDGSNTQHDGTTTRLPPRPPPPMALYLFGLASILAIVQLHSTTSDHESTTTNDDDTTTILDTHVWGVWALKGITVQDISRGFWEGAVPQLPLTLLNSVVSVCCLVDSLFPERRQQRPYNSISGSQQQILPPREVAASIGVINLLACPLGALPVCHGAGGLAAQYKFGARHGTSIVILGVCKITAAMVAGPTRLLRFLDALPLSILAVLILVAGHELAVTGLASIVPPENSRIAGREERQEDDSNDDDEDSNDNRRQISSFRTEVGVCLWTAAVIVGLHKTHYGALTGCVAYLLQGQGFVRLQSALCGGSQHVT
eukprot:scaffold1353_cov161-Amphora_coffeaeformis.AAC.17